MATKFTYKNDNSVEDGGAFFTVPGTITVGVDAFVYNFTSNLAPNNYGEGFMLLNGSYTVTVNGIVGTTDASTAGSGILFNDGVGTSKLTVGDLGYIFGGFTGVAAFHATNITNSGQIDGATYGLYEGGDGKWSVTNNKDALIQSLNTAILIDGTGVHTITNAGGIYSDSTFAIFAPGGGDEKLTNSGYITGAIDLGDGNDVFSNSGDLSSNLSFGDGANSFINKGTVDSDFGPLAITFGTGNDVFTNSARVDADVDFGDGNNSFTNKSDNYDGDLNFGNGNNTFKNSGGFQGIVTFGDGNNTYTNSGHDYFGPEIYFGDGNNVFTNTGTMAVAIFFGSGNDKVTNTGTLLGESYVELGGGNDSYTGGKTDEGIADEGGNDIYKFGPGDDWYYAVDSSGGDIDTADGGTGLDYFSAYDSISDLVINLDSKNQFDPYYSLIVLGKTATDDGLGDIGLNKISNFESVEAGDGDDTVFGTAGSNDITGGAGDDDLFGLAGNDFLDGGDDEDYLIGGAGKDTLSGGGDGEEDRFIYTDVKDSTSAAKGRDVILDFEDNVDVIDLSSIVLKGGAAHFVGTNARFGDGQVGDVRAMMTGTGWTIQMDAQKDGVPDFAIDVVDLDHVITWSSADFIFDMVMV
jgi:hypothetical protein